VAVHQRQPQPRAQELTIREIRPEGRRGPGSPCSLEDREEVPLSSRCLVRQRSRTEHGGPRQTSDFLVPFQSLHMGQPLPHVHSEVGWVGLVFSCHIPGDSAGTEWSGGRWQMYHNKQTIRSTWPSYRALLFHQTPVYILP
jgi:hypothetical protein